MVSCACCRGSNHKEACASHVRLKVSGILTDVSCACSVRSCTVPEASASCRSRLRTHHGIILFLGPMKAPRAGMKGGWWTSRFKGPSLATKGVLGGTPYTSWLLPANPPLLQRDRRLAPNEARICRIPCWKTSQETRKVI